MHLLASVAVSSVKNGIIIVNTFIYPIWAWELDLHQRKPYGTACVLTTGFSPLPWRSCPLVAEQFTAAIHL